MEETSIVQRKLAVLGCRGVGKTSLSSFFVDGRFSENYEPTIENTLRKLIRFRRIHFECTIIDSAGMDETSRLSRNCTLGVHGWILVYNITDRQSFEKIQVINELLIHMLGDCTEYPRILVGNMADLNSARQVEKEEGMKLSESWGVPFLECSAKCGINVGDVFTGLIRFMERENGLVISNTPALTQAKKDEAPSESICSVS